MSDVSDAPKNDLPPYWVLISVLFSSFPMSPSLAMTLHQAAYQLFRTGDTVQQVIGDMVSGQVTNLKKDVALGGIAGPMFEAKVDTERGSGTVRFLLTRQGLQLMEEREKKPQYLN